VDMIRATTDTRLHLELLCKGEKEKGPTEVLRFTDTPYKRKADNDAAQIHRVLQTTRSDGWMLSGLHCISAIVVLKTLAFLRQSMRYWRLVCSSFVMADVVEVVVLVDLEPSSLSSQSAKWVFS